MRKREKKASRWSSRLEAYQRAGYPDRFLRSRENAKTKRGESDAVAKLLTYFKVKRVGDLDQAVCDEYHH